MSAKHGPQYPREWNTDLIVIRARRFGLHGSDVDDAIEEIILDVIGFCFDPTRSNGASERTALIALIDNRLKEQRRKHRRYDTHLRRAAAELRNVRPAASDASRLIRASLMAADVCDAIQRLSPFDQAVCAGLAQDHSVNRIARELGCGWKRVATAEARIRAKFESWDLDQWLEER